MASYVDYLAPYGVRLTEPLNPPQITSSVVGATGTTTYSYCATFVTLVGESLPSIVTSVTNGNSVLNGFQEVLLTVSPVPASVTYVRFWKQVSGVWYILANVAPSTNTASCQVYDTGQTITTGTIPSTDTSGRAGVLAICNKSGTYNQRINWTDLQALLLTKNQRLWDSIHANGDIINGCSPARVIGTSWVAGNIYSVGDVVYVDSSSQFSYKCTTSGTSSVTPLTGWPTVVNSTFSDGSVTWTTICNYTFTKGEVYLFGTYVDIPAGTVSLTGVGDEQAGLVISPYVTTSDQDIVQRAGIDEGVPNEVASTGPDWLYIQITWATGSSAQVIVQKFTNGVPKQIAQATQRTALEIELARQRYDTSGSFVADPFQLGIVTDASDNTKLQLQVNSGKAYPMGYEVTFQGVQLLPFAKARDTQLVADSAISGFDCPGGYAITANAGPFAVDGLSIAIQIGNGNTHTVTFVGSCSASQLCSQIALAVNSYPSSGVLVYCNAANTGVVEIQAAPNQSLTFVSCTNPAYSVLGLSIGTFSPIGTRVYSINDSYVKDVNNLSYEAPVVSAVTHNGNTGIDSLIGIGLVPATSSVIQILGASNLQADAIDGKWNYTLQVDFVKDGNNISFAGMGGAKPNSGSTYYVAYQYQRIATKGVRQLVTVTDAPMVKGARGAADTLTYSGAVSIVDTVTGVSIPTPPTGTVIDAVSITRVNNSTGQTQTQYTNYTFLKNATALTLNPSQISWASADSTTSITGQPITSTNGSPNYYVTFTAWFHSAEGDYVSADSYSSYANIETFSGINLRDALDFRTVGGVLPLAGQSPVFNYDYYLSRIDKLVVDSFANFYLLPGTPAFAPQVPADQDGTLSLAIVALAPYTYTLSDVNITNLQSLRITQQGIQRMQEQIQELQYSAVTQGLANQVASTPIAATKVSIFTDSLTGFGNIDINFNKNGVAFTAAIDRVNQCLRLVESQDVRIITVNNEASSHVRFIGNSAMLDYEPYLVKQQPYASVWINGASDYTYTNYKGLMFISPQTDVFVDQNQKPAVNVDFANNLGNLTSAVNGLLANDVDWGSWQTTGVTNGNYRSEGAPIYGDGNQGPMETEYWSWDQQTAQTRTGIQQALLPGSITQDLGSSVVDLSLQGMMRTTNADGTPFTIKLNITGLMPNVDHACTIGGIPVDLTYDPQPVDPNGGSANYQPVGLQGTNTYQGKACATTSNIGSLTAKVVMPAGIPIGNTTISVFYYAQPQDSSTSAAFYSAGFMETTQDTTIGLPTTTLSQTQVSQNQTITTTNSIMSFYGMEPLCETFYSGADTTYYSQIELFFKSKSATLGYTVQICPVVNGYPNTEQVLASTHFTQDLINVSDDASVGTTFVFENVLGYQPNTWYCFNGKPDYSNTDYNLWAVQLGDIDKTTSQRVTAVPAEGVLFHSPNNSTWEPKEKTYLKYNIYKSNFQNNCQIVFDNLTGVQASLLCLQVQQFISPGTGVVWSYSLDNKVTWIPFTPGINTDLGSIINQICLMVDVTSIGGNYHIVSQFAGIVLLYHNASGDYIGNDTFFTNNLTYPNHVTATLDIQAGGGPSDGVRTVIPYFTVDDGATWVQLVQKPNDDPPATLDSGYYTCTFCTPPQASVDGVTTGGVTTINSVNHLFQNNALVVLDGIQGVTGLTQSPSTDGYSYRVSNASANAFTILDANTGANIVTSGTYTSGGTINLAEFTQFRPRVSLSTTNRAVTPKVKNIGMIPAQY